MWLGLFGSLETSLRRLGSGLLIGLLFAGSGCVSARVESNARAEVEFDRYATLHLLDVVVGDEAASTNTDLSTKIEDAAREGIAARGYRLASDDGADLTMEVSLAVERVARTTWDSDPDANSLVLREFTEAVVVLRAVDRTRQQEVWRAEARSRLPEPDLLIGRKSETVWKHALLEAISRLPMGGGTEARS